MKIAHYAQFAPNGCGMYEAARDMIVADRQAGHETYFVDTGAQYVNGNSDEPKIGAVDDRHGQRIVTISPEDALDADIIITHATPQDRWLVKTQAPIISVLHGRPQSCFAVEHRDNKRISYSFLNSLSKWPRLKKFITFWPKHEPFWKLVIPKDKLEVFRFPPIDKTRFKPQKTTYDFDGKKGELNLVIADSYRDDINPFEVINGAILAAKEIKGLKVHLFCIPDNHRPCWEYLFSGLREIGALGAVWGRRQDMEEVYQAADVVLSPQRIITRSIGEPLCCGTPVVAHFGCELATYTTTTEHPPSVVNALKKLIKEIQTNRDSLSKSVMLAASNLCLDRYNSSMAEVYGKVG